MLVAQAILVILRLLCYNLFLYVLLKTFRKQVSSGRLSRKYFIVSLFIPARNIVKAFMYLQKKTTGHAFKYNITIDV